MRKPVIAAFLLGVMGFGDASAQGLDVPYERTGPKKTEEPSHPVESTFEKKIVIKAEKSDLVLCSEGAVQQIDPEVALASCNAAIAENPENAEAFYYRGYNHFHLARYEDAEADYTRAIELKTRYLAESYYQRGTCREMLRRLRDAAADFKKANELKPDWSPARRKVEEYHWAYE